MKDFKLSLEWFIKNSAADKNNPSLTGLANIYVKGISTDSRSIKKDEIFIALKGENFDGHHHVDEAIKKGALAAIVENDFNGNGNLYIKVPDTLKTLGKLAASLRMERELSVVALSGSNGKTSTKELLKSILKLKDPHILSTEGNLNNHVGLPLTIFNLSEKSHIAVLEMGANHFGEIAYLSQIAQANVGLITSIGKAHMEFFKTLSNVAKAKGELFANLPQDAVAVVNADEPLLLREVKKFKGNKLYFGKSAQSQVKLGEIKPRGLEGQELILYGPGAEKGITVFFKLLGEHNAHNALAASAAALAAGASWSEIACGLTKAESFPGRLMAIRSQRGGWLIDDSYNANPSSMKAGLNFLATCQIKAEKGAIIGDMGELGPSEKKFHREIGLLAAELKLDFLACVGPLSQASAKEAVKAGMKKDNVAIFDDAISAARWVKESRNKNSLVLIKASHYMGLDAAVSFLK